MPRRVPAFSRNPADANVTINTGELSAEEAAQEIILHLEREGFIGVNKAGE
jgi:hypothetical protein